MKSKITLVLIIVSLSLGLYAQKAAPDFSNLHYLSAEEMQTPLRSILEYVETDPPMPVVRNVAEFDAMQAVLVRYPFGIPITLVKEMAEETMVITLVGSSSQQQTVENIYAANDVNTENTSFLIAPTDSYWVRDYGPWFVFDGNNNPGIMDFPYNRPRPNDDNVPVAVANSLGIDLYGMSVYHTGGNYMCDGMGQASSTDLVYEENTQLTEAQVDEKHNDYLGINPYHVRPDPLDDYIKHIDCWGKFLSPSKVIIGQVPPTDNRFEDFEAAANYFANSMSSYGVPYEVVRVFTPGTSPNTPYTNSLILNKKVFVPLTGSQWDDEAIATYEEAMPGYEIVGIVYNGWLNTDALHCRTKGVADIGMLYIHHVPTLGQVDSQDTYEITAQINVNSGQPIYEDSVFVYYSVNEGEYQQTNMVSTTGEMWTATISGVMAGDEVDYYLYAADESGRQAYHPFIGQADPHEFEVTDVVVENLEMNPDTLLYLDFEDALEGLNLDIINRGSEAVNIEDITEFGMEFMWYVENMPTLPYSIAAEDTLKLMVMVDLPVDAPLVLFVSDTMYISTETNTYKQLLIIDNDLISSEIENSIENISVYPNPFSTNVHFTFNSKSQENVSLKIFSINGQLVHHEQIITTAVNNSISWDGNSNRGSRLPEGIYFYELAVGKQTKNGKVILSN